VVTVHDVGRLNDGRPYFVMDYADRGTLAPRLDRKGGYCAPEPQSLVALVDAVADGLTAIHDAGVVHRDIKPDNILFQVARRGQPEPDPIAAEFATRLALVKDDERILVGDLGHRQGSDEAWQLRDAAGWHAALPGPRAGGRQRGDHAGGRRLCRHCPALAHADGAEAAGRPERGRPARRPAVGWHEVIEAGHGD
jgi:hypothetical protein